MSDKSTRGPLALANTMHLKVVAEGVETPTQARALAEMGCDLAQGYLLARPMPADVVDQLLATRLRDASLNDLEAVRAR